MSDFLADLVERSIGRSSAVRPQPFSIFEPPSPGRETFFRAAEFPGPPSGEAKDAEAPDRIQPLRSWSQTMVAQRSTPITPHVAVELESAESPGMPAEIGPHLHRAGEQQNVAASEVGAPSGNATTGRGKSSGTPPQISPRITRPPSGPRRTPPAWEASPSRPVPSANQVESREPAVNHRREKRAQEIVRSRTAEEERSRRPLMQVRDLRVLSSRPAAPGRFASAPPPETPPVPPAINVTIGRVEVRATLPAPPAKTPLRPATPILSLDEYLRQRAAGDR